MAFNLNPGRSPFQQTGNGLPSALLQTNPVSGSTKKKVKNKNGEIFEKTTTTTTTPGTSGTPATVIKGKAGTPGTPGQKDPYKGPKASNKDWTSFLKTPKGQEYTKKTKGTSPTPGTPDVVIPGTPGTPPKTTIQESQAPVMGAVTEAKVTRGYIGANAGKTSTKANVTSSNVSANSYVKGTNAYNKSINAKYSQAEEGSAKANGLTGKVLENRNKKAEERKKLLTRKVEVTTTPNNAGTARKVAAEKKKQNVKNDGSAAFQLKSQNKKMAPTKMKKC
jgi:hypothetical protein